MPLVTIHTRRGLSAHQKAQVFDAVHGALVTAFRIPDEDRHQRLVEHEAENLDLPASKGDRWTLVEIDAFAGRSVDAKRLLYKEVVERLGAAGVPPGDIQIVVRDVPLESWGIRGGKAACDIDLGFDFQV